MKVLAINGSARLDGNTAALLRVAMGECEAAGVETELVQLAGQAVRGCTGCGACAKLKNQRCNMTDDVANDVMQKIFDADGILVGTPTYYANATPEILGWRVHAWSAATMETCCDARWELPSWRYVVRAPSPLLTPSTTSFSSVRWSCRVPRTGTWESADARTK
jgi:hypothetical protein